jgi:cyclic-di-GMP phosphodiesterase TipF (flagellum assembly factor)
MRLSSHFWVFASYTLAALVTAIALPALAPGIDWTASGLMGLVVFLGGGLAQEVYARCLGDIRTKRHLGVLRKAYGHNKEQLLLARDEARRIFEALESAQPSGALDDSRELSDIASEVRVLHSLVEQLYSQGDTPSDRISAGHPDDENEPRIVPLSGPGETGILEIVREALRQDRVELYLQPIVSLPQRKSRFFECFSRIRSTDGAIVSPEQYVDIARRTGLIAAIDNMLLFRSVQLLRKIQKHSYSTAIFCNVSSHTISDRAFLRDFIDYMEGHTELAASLILEFVQGDIDLNDECTAGYFARLSKLGYRFSMDQMSELDIDFANLATHGFRYVKVEASELLMRSDGGPNILRWLKQAIDGPGIDLIVEKIETEQMLSELMDYNIDFGQGYLFGEPRLSKGEPAQAEDV